LPSKPGVYLYLNQDNEIIYVGKAKDLKSRVSSYFTSPNGLGPKTRALVEQIDKIKIVEVESEVESLLLEAFYIKKHRPRYNIRLVDGKAYPFIRISMEDRYPVISLSRRMDHPKSLYFGPFPNAGAVRLVLKTVRRIFPFVSVPHHPKSKCLYYHLGLCPCPPAFDSPEYYKQYRKTIRRIVKMMEGESKSLVKELMKERDESAKHEDFEQAQVLQNKISALQLITEPVHRPFEYDVNPNLREDLRWGELEGLKTALTEQGLMLSDLSRIECYDISNIQGTNATGSMVVLTNGEIDKSQYRKFKIRQDGKPNDFAMMQEMLERRLKHRDWEEPSLIVVDGGKGQLSSALEAMATINRPIPVVGLAKREETIIIPVEQQFYHPEKRQSTNGQRHKLYGDNEEHFIEVSLPKDSQSLHLVQRIRDEAHRFAITYHRKLRGKAALAA
jgi:excinuclease ABC subunit C